MSKCHVAQAGLNSLHCWKWPWSADSVSKTSWVLGFQLCVIKLNSENGISKKLCYYYVSVTRVCTHVYVLLVSVEVRRQLCRVSSPIPLSGNWAQAARPPWLVFYLLSQLSDLKTGFLNESLLTKILKSAANNVATLIYNLNFPTFNVIKWK